MFMYLESRHASAVHKCMHVDTQCSKDLIEYMLLSCCCEFYPYSMLSQSSLEFNVDTMHGPY